ncbi:conserved hypothetical protein [Leishmania braziliensis MHOM/BR/75/M2904]|uniref:Ig-like domain-containing protein n=2 Tax=Leishmania braziliensis TaxID=5660 RepID=A4HF52_LEIBR|nr:conserved hypothetical protein [Leishmania braziliensis MHOM/BR/75/M2904]CAJ2474868.1 unnamed protein product [Leishmania braziliensis]CAM39462.1 conserved hypothetical protein [Leishmania braziliensis MHOM/BR/75/M2904]SYZ66869.1 hypothetical_protein [Leishmania braziliensis MHOM/BR/75/M2904]
MGGESSKHSNSSAHARRREGRRSAAPHAQAGADYHLPPLNVHPARLGPSYGEAPEYIPPSPVQCAASPILSSSSLDPSLTWMLDTEAVLITEWNRSLQNVATSSSGPFGVWQGGEAVTDDSKMSCAVTTPQSGVSTTASNTLGLTSSSTCLPLSGSLLPAHLQSSTGLALGCDSVTVTTGRSTGMSLRVPTTWSHPKPSWSNVSPKTMSSPKSPQATPHPLSVSSEGAPSLVVSTLPVGIDYFRVLQSRWLAVEQPLLPPTADEEELSDSVILEAVSEVSGDVLQPPVPLGHMIALFVPQWRSEGLFEAAQHSQAR